MGEYWQRVPEVIFRIILVVSIVMIAKFVLSVMPHPDPAVPPTAAISSTKTPHIPLAAPTQRAALSDWEQDRIDMYEGQDAEADEIIHGGPLD
jgi:hypothetical protein